MSAVAAAVLTFVAVLLWPRGRGSARATVRGKSGWFDESSGEAARDVTGARGRWRWLPLLRRRAGGEDGSDVLVVLDALGPAMKAGLSPALALRLASAPQSRGPGSAPVAGRAGDSLTADLVAAGELGRPLAPVWAEAAARNAVGSRGTGRASAELGLVASAWALSEQLGAPVADAVTMAGSQVRARRQRRQRVQVALAGPRATITVLTVLPLGGPLLALMVGVGPGALYSSPVAQVSVFLGLALMAVGRWWCSRMVATLERPAAAPGVRAGEERGARSLDGGPGRRQDIEQST